VHGGAGSQRGDREARFNQTQGHRHGQAIGPHPAWNSDAPREREATVLSDDLSNRLGWRLPQGGEAQLTTVPIHCPVGAERPIEVTAYRLENKGKRFLGGE
jgi:hypothetical protein